MAQKILIGRIALKHDTTENWNKAKDFIPMRGEVIVYEDYRTVEVNGESIAVPGIKVGTGNAYVQDLVFVGEAEARQLLAHIADADVHTTASEKKHWNEKLNIDDAEEVSEETLLFNRN